MALALPLQTLAQRVLTPRPVADMGTLPYGADTITHHFTLLNTGQEPLTIGFVSSSCDCARPEWPRLPLAPGDSGRVRVRFLGKEPGPFEKSFTVYDDLRRPVARFTLKGVVPPRPEPLPPGPIRYQMDYNALDTDSGRRFFQDLAVRIRATGIPKKIVVHSSASKVPTQSFSSNEALAQERADRARQLLSGALKAQGMVPDRMQWQRTVKVQGPAWKAGTSMDIYRPYQYVAVEVVY